MNCFKLSMIVALVLSGTDLLFSQDVFEREPVLQATHAHLVKRYKEIGREIEFSGSSIVVKNNDSISMNVDCPRGCFWGDVVFSKNGDFCSLIANRGTKTGGYSSYKAYLLDLRGGMDSLTVYCLSDSINVLTKRLNWQKAAIGRVLHVSNGGKLVLVEVYRSVESTTEVDATYNVAELVQIDSALKNAKRFEFSNDKD